MTATNWILPLERLDAQPDRAFIQEDSSFASTTQARRLDRLTELFATENPSRSGDACAT